MSDLSASFIDVFPQQSHIPPASSYDSTQEGDQNGETSSIVKQNRAFWKSQKEVLQVAKRMLDLEFLITFGCFYSNSFIFQQATLKRTNSIELKTRQATKDAIRETDFKSIQCGCRRPAEVAVCRECVQREVCNNLRNAGYNCAVCKSKWKSSPEIPSGK